MHLAPAVAMVAPVFPLRMPTVQTDGSPEYRIGQTLSGAYKLTAILDCGGMATVYRAEHLRLKRVVAIKLISAALRGSERALARFRREAELMGQLVHPHIVQVLDYDTTDRGEPYLVMELLQGETLAKRLLREGTLPLDEAVRIIGQIASGLRCAHEAGVVHRDLKPSNVFLVDLVDEPSFVKLLDFGISKQTRSAGRSITNPIDLVGTPEYMSPEQASGRSAEADAWTDQFSLAVVAYEMISGRHPFWAPDVRQTLHKISNEPVQPICSADSELPAALDAVLQRALSKNPRHRYENVSALAAALAEAAGFTSSCLAAKQCDAWQHCSPKGSRARGPIDRDGSA